MRLVRTKGPRGLAIVEFIDTYNQECNLQESSSAIPAVWLGVEWALDTRWIAGGSGDFDTKPAGGSSRLVNVGARMHLTRTMARKLIAELQHFVDTGEVKRGRR